MAHEGEDGRARCPRLLLGAILLLGALLRVLALGAESLWSDEGFTWWWAQQPLVELWGANGRLETNPPLYYTLQHLWLVFGDSETALRSLPALFGIATIPLAYAAGRVVGGRRAGLLAALLLATSAVHVYYSQEARAYTLLTAAATLAVLGFLRFLATNDPPPATGGRQGLAAYALGTTAALYAHNTALFLPLIANLAALLWWVARARRERRFLLAWLLANLGPFLLWLGWLPVVLTQAGGAPTIAWLQQPALPSAVREALRLYSFRYLAAPWLDLAAPVALLAGWGVLAAPPRRRPLALVLLAFVAGVPALTYLAGLLGRPLWVERTLLWPLPLGLALLATGLLAVRPRGLGLVLLALLAVIQAGNLRGLHALPQKPPMRALAADLARDWRAGDGLLLLPQGIQFSAAYYLRRHGRMLEAVGLGEDPERLAPSPLVLAHPLRPPVGLPVVHASLATLDERLQRWERVWLLARRRDRLDPDGRVMAKLARFGPVARVQHYPPYLELILIDRARGP
ncbi:glycosyltransferase family 39 protein [Benzoatithermus flavus]|uniref:Glycosyltransferase family 39 protein n=1 Tax=Benzoatithermus flavus TaxID=3108223 RepID=A0ABU8XVS8_9PROT